MYLGSTVSVEGRWTWADGVPLGVRAFLMTDGGKGAYRDPWRSCEMVSPGHIKGGCPGKNPKKPFPSSVAFPAQLRKTDNGAMPAQESSPTQQPDEGRTSLPQEGARPGNTSSPGNRE